MVNSHKLALSFDPARLQADLEAIAPTEWTDHFVDRNYEGSWQVVPLRGPAGATHPVQMIYSDPTCTDFADTPFLDRCPYFREVLESFRCPLTSARLMKLTPGSRILEHHDYDLSLEEGNARLHIPVTTNPGVDFRLAAERLVLAAGECWYLRLSETHSVCNGGATDRVHLVVDAMVNDWLAEMIPSTSG